MTVPASDEPGAPGAAAAPGGPGIRESDSKEQILPKAFRTGVLKLPVNLLVSKRSFTESIECGETNCELAKKLGSDDKKASEHCRNGP